MKLMLLELSKIKGLSVGSFDQGVMVGKVIKAVISYKEQKILGFIVKPSGMFSSSKLASIEDVIDIDQAGLVVHSADNLVDLDEVVRVSEIIKTNFNLIGLKAISREGKNLGKVYDALIDSQTGDIVRIYVRQMLSDYVFDQTQIEEITLDKVKLRNEKRQRSKKSLEVLGDAKVA